MLKFSRRMANLLAAIGCFALIAIAYYYMEKELVLIPCPLCYAQRIAFGFIGVYFLFAAIIPGGSVGGKIHGIVLFFTSLASSGLSIRHLYLQNLPKGTAPSCGTDFYGLVENTPFAEIVKIMITGSSDCGEVQWEMFSLSIPGWSLIVFIGLAFWGLFHNAFRP